MLADGTRTKKIKKSTLNTSLPKMAALVSEIFWLHFWTVRGSGDSSSIFIFSRWRGVWQKLQETSVLRSQQNCTLGNVGTRFWPEKKVWNKKKTLWRREEAEAHQAFHRPSDRRHDLHTTWTPTPHGQIKMLQSVTDVYIQPRVFELSAI